jgi:hypothetical protein
MCFFIGITPTFFSTNTAEKIATPPGSMLSS